MSFVTRTFLLPSYVAQIDVAPNIPRISGERNIKAFGTFVPKFYYSYSQDQSVGVFRGKFFSPTTCGINNPYDNFAWSRSLLTKQYVEKTDYEFGYIQATDEVLARGHFTTGQLLKCLFPNVSVKPSFMGQIALEVGLGKIKKSDVVKAIEKCTDCAFVLTGGTLTIKVDSAKVRSKLEATLDEYERVGVSGAGQMSFLDHKLLLES